MRATKKTVVFTLNVLVMQRGEFWIAQGVELDYEAQGRSWSDVRYAFERGLVATAQAHVRRFGHLEHLFTPAPDRIQQEFKRVKKVALKRRALRRKPAMQAQAFLPFDGSAPEANIHFMVAA